MPERIPAAFCVFVQKRAEVFANFRFIATFVRQLAVEVFETTAFDSPPFRSGRSLPKTPTAGLRGPITLDCLRGDAAAVSFRWCEYVNRAGKLRTESVP